MEGDFVSLHFPAPGELWVGEDATSLPAPDGWQGRQDAQPWEMVQDCWLVAVAYLLWVPDQQTLVSTEPGINIAWYQQSLVSTEPGINRAWYQQNLVSTEPGVNRAWYQHALATLQWPFYSSHSVQQPSQYYSHLVGHLWYNLVLLQHIAWLYLHLNKTTASQS